jgi:diadenosine tetraphosphate (Ap4A) HIT family hydrolase
MTKYYYGRSDTDTQDYRQYRQHQTDCVFCKINNPDSIDVIIEADDDFWVVKNAFPYQVFDNIEVSDHLLVVPKKHVESLSELSQHQRGRLIKILSRYEKLGYSIMSRSPNNRAKSVAHQHTHLIKLV